MKLAETVVFGGSGLDRADALRGDDAQLARLIADGAAETIVLWQGKVLVSGDLRDTLVRVSLDHPILSRDPGCRLLLGRDEAGGLIFGHDISAWSPDLTDPAELGSFTDSSVQIHPDYPDGAFVELRAIMASLTPRDAELAATARSVLCWHESHRFCSKCGALSTMARSGWQRSCDSCGGQHFPRTDPVVIMLITYGNAVLVGRSPGWPEGMYSLLAGFVEPGETIEAAVRREVFEEAGIPVGTVSYLASQPWAFPSSLMLGCAGEALVDNIIINPEEIEDACWVSREEMMMSFAGLNPKLKPARKGSIAQFLLRNWLADTLN